MKRDNSDEDMSGASPLGQLLLSHRPRETGGGIASNRFAFQRTWALCHLLDLHRAPGDYVLIMEFHDDVLVIDSPSSPSTADFFQVKTRRDGMWKQREFTTVEKAKKSKKRENSQKEPPTTDLPAMEAAEVQSPRSILGKLMEHARHFGAAARSLTVVSNARFDLDAAAEPLCRDRPKICASDLTLQSISEIREKLEEELGVGPLPVDRVFFVSTGMSLTEHENHGTGVLARFLDDLRPGGRFTVVPLYRTICDELARRANCEWQLTSLPDLCQRKGLSRDDLERFLQSAEGLFDPQAKLAEALDQLSREDVPYRDTQRFAQGWRRYQVECTDGANVVVQQFRDNVRAVVDTCMSEGDWQSLRDLVRLAMAEYQARHGEPKMPFDVTYLEGAILFEIKSTESGRIQAPGQESPKGAA